MTPWEFIETRMRQRDIANNTALAERIAAVEGLKLQDARRKVQRWAAGGEPGDTSRETLAAILGGVPDDYKAATPPTVASLSEDLAAVQRKLDDVLRQLGLLLAGSGVGP